MMKRVTPRTIRRLFFFAIGVAGAYAWFLHSSRNQLNVDPAVRGVIEKARGR